MSDEEARERIEARAARLAVALPQPALVGYHVLLGLEQWVGLLDTSLAAAARRSAVVRTQRRERLGGLDSMWMRDLQVRSAFGCAERALVRCILDTCTLRHAGAHA